MRSLFISRMLVIAGFVLMICLLLMSVVFYTLANFNEHLDLFSSSIKNQDRIASEKSFRQLETDYEYLTDFKLRYLADRVWFNETHLYKAVQAYLAEDCDKVDELLRGHEDDYRASYLAGLCKFRLFQAAYQRAKTNKEKADIQARAMERILPDFERCVKEGPGIEKNFNCSFDYDLVSDPKNFKNALENPRSGPPIILGVPGDSPGNQPGMKNPLDRNPNDQGAGSNNPKRGG